MMSLSGLYAYSLLPVLNALALFGLLLLITVLQMLRADRAEDRLHELRSALPKTKDCVTIVPGMRVCIVQDGIFEDGVLVKSIHSDGGLTIEASEEIEAHMDMFGFDIYSTREAAEEAAKETTHD